MRHAALVNRGVPTDQIEVGVVEHVEFDALSRTQLALAGAVRAVRVPYMRLASSAGKAKPVPSKTSSTVALIWREVRIEQVMTTRWNPRSQRR